MSIKLADVKELTLILQSPKSKVCGQCCIAMVAHIGLSEAIEHFGHKKGTKTRDLVRVLNEIGIPNSGELVRVRDDRIRPLHRISKMVYIPRKRSGWHWVVHWNGKRYDPSGVSVDGFMNWRETSYIAIGTKHGRFPDSRGNA